MKIRIKVEDKKYTPIPATGSSAGMDLRATEEKKIFPGQRVTIKTGVRVEIPGGFFGAVCSRSGLAFKHGVCVPNDPGIIDPDYRGDIHVLLYNFSKEPFTVKKGDRIAQLIIQKYEEVDWEWTDELEQTERGEKGLGSTGV